MRRVVRYSLLLLALVCLIPGMGRAQDQGPKIVEVPVSPAAPDLSSSLPPLEDPATEAQIREYLRLSGDLNSFRVRWVAALDKNRSIGSPYWPESFWAALKTEMQTVDLMPMFVILYQHGISRKLMQEVLDTYHALGAEHFKGTPACFMLGDAESKMTDDMDKLKFAKTIEVIQKVYAIYKPQINAARAQYMATHPDWAGK